MGDLLKPEVLALFLVFTVPGVIALFFRSQFLAGRMPPVSEGALAYITLSLAYHAMAFPLARGIYTSGRIDGAYGLGWFGLLFATPAVLGVILGLNIRKGWSKALLARIGINTIHPVHSVWDWRFAACEECWVIVTLKDETRFYGYLGTGSFASSDAAERDLYVEYVYDFVEEGEPWTPRGSSVWLAHGEIRSIEYLPR